MGGKFIALMLCIGALWFIYPEYAKRFVRCIVRFPSSQLGISVLSLILLACSFIASIMTTRRFVTSPEMEGLLKLLSQNNGHEEYCRPLLEPGQNINDFLFGLNIMDILSTRLGPMPISVIVIILLLLWGACINWNCSDLQRSDPIRLHVGLQVKKFLKVLLIFVIVLTVWTIANLDIIKVGDTFHQQVTNSDKGSEGNCSISTAIGSIPQFPHW